MESKNISIQKNNSYICLIVTQKKTITQKKSMVKISSSAEIGKIS